MIGIELAVEEINAAGGIDGKKLNLLKLIINLMPAEATNAAIKLTTQDKVVAIIGAATSGNYSCTSEIANDNKTPIITPSGTSPTVTVKDRWKS